MITKTLAKHSVNFWLRKIIQLLMLHIMGLQLVLKLAIKVLRLLISPAKFDEIPDGLKDPDGKWFAIHYGTSRIFCKC